MKVIIFGATGETGKQLIERPLEKGYITSAFVRNNLQKLTKYQNNIAVFRGDVLNFDAVDKAIKDQDAVIVALGVVPGRTKHTLSGGTANIIRSMEKHSVRRLVVETGAGLAEGRNQLPFLWKFTSKIPPMRGMFNDKRKQEKLIKSSSLDWIIVRPANLTNSPATSNYITGEKLILRMSSTISRADVSDFMVSQITSQEWLKKSVIISQNNNLL